MIGRGCLARPSTTLMIGSGCLTLPAVMLILLTPATAAPAVTIAITKVIAFFTVRYPARPQPFWPFRGRYERQLCAIR